MSSIHFFCEDIDFDLEQANLLSNWLIQVATEHDAEIEDINYIFCSDTYLLEINRQYLNHDYFTDIITFDNSAEGEALLSDIFVSVDRVKDNANIQGITFEQEMHRVLVHGLLHLLGYNDKESDDQILMRQKEDACLSLLKK
jgi:rRNA maturation RNase YbeY